jgi:hypothetical protein
MDDNLIYYLVLGAIYLVSRMLKKKKPVKPVSRPLVTKTEEYQEPLPQRASPKKPSSFEDLLKEISQEFSERKEDPVKQIKVIEEPVKRIEPVVEKREPTREEKYVKKRHAEMAEEKRKNELKRMLEEEEEHEPHAVMALLQEDGGAANAVILAEIMNKKY